jgi:hypothetical protein
MHPGRDTFGVISVYVTGERELPASIDAAQFVANAVGAALLRDPTAQGFDNDSAWASRSQVHEATGMVATQLQLPPDDALAILRAHAYAHEIPLTETARQVVDRHLHFRAES